MTGYRLYVPLFPFAALLVIGSCSEQGGMQVPRYTIGGTVSGLSATLVLRNNGGDDRTVTANGPFTFATSLSTGSSYSVTVFTQPPTQICTVTGGSGTVTSTAITTVAVACTTVPAEVDVIFIVDGSGSMSEERAEFLSEINAFAAAASAGHSLRVILIGDNSLCVPAPLGSGSCPADANPPGYGHVQVNIGSTDALAQVINTYASWGPLTRPAASKMFVVLTDDNSDMTSSDFDTALKALHPSLQDYVFSAYVADYSGSSLDPCFQHGTPGSVYQDLRTLTGGVLGNLCSQDMTPFLTALVGAL